MAFSTEEMGVLDRPDTRSVARLSDIVGRIAGQHGAQRVPAPTESLVDAGLNSMAMVELMLAVEAEFDVTIPQKEMTPTNFQTIVSLARLIDRL